MAGHSAPGLRSGIVGHIPLRGVSDTDASTSFTDIQRRHHSPELLDHDGLGALTGLTAGTPAVTDTHDVFAAALGIGGTPPARVRVPAAISTVYGSSRAS
ncbi:hypothetical protein ABZ471_34100 [Streptomyces sp. NPDC005728]|uniref:hypothetical protein n=1 Tax=Streptomyces sp. NPDC005728 TaxID=3157054 RepID=UPI0033F8D180